MTKATGTITDGEEFQWGPSIKNELSELVSNVKSTNLKIANATTFAQNIGDGKFDLVLDSATKDFGLGVALDEMRTKLKNVAEEERKRNWAVEGHAKFGQLFRDHQNDDLKEFSYIVILNIAKYINASQGAVFISNETRPEDPFIELFACFAYDRRKFKDKRIELNEGLVGQCMVNKSHIYIDNIPRDYAKITSGLGEGSPRALLLVPLKTNDEVFGAIELASFEMVEAYQIKLVNEIADSFSTTLSSARINQNTQKLLLESEKYANELLIKENELVSNEEELRSAQETLNNKLIELQAETNLTKCILEAINKSNAAIEFDMDGHILNANEMFLSVMGYEKSEIIGLDEKTMVPETELLSSRYEMLWDSLKKGNFNTGEFKRYAKNGKEVWIEATYNPILDLAGRPYKILMFANFTTESKEKENDFKNRINAFNETFGSLEINPDFTIKSANQIFLDLHNLRRKDLKNISFDQLIDNNLNGIHFADLVKTELEKGKAVRQKISIQSEKGIVNEYFLSVNLSKNIAGKLVSYFALIIPSNFTNSVS
ncbi:MAG: PAS domain-containing protein [Cytophagales bacterium]